MPIVAPNAAPPKEPPTAPIVPPIFWPRLFAENISDIAPVAPTIIGVLDMIPAKRLVPAAGALPAGTLAGTRPLGVSTGTFPPRKLSLILIAASSFIRLIYSFKALVISRIFLTMNIPVRTLIKADSFSLLSTIAFKTLSKIFSGSLVLTAFSLTIPNAVPIALTTPMKVSQTALPIMPTISPKFLMISRIVCLCSSMYVSSLEIQVIMPLMNFEAIAAYSFSIPSDSRLLMLAIVDLDMSKDDFITSPVKTDQRDLRYIPIPIVDVIASSVPDLYFLPRNSKAPTKSLAVNLPRADRS